MKTTICIFFILMFSFNVSYSQMMNMSKSSDNNLFNDSYLYSGETPSLSDIKDINFKRRRFANMLMYIEAGAGGQGDGTEYHGIINYELILESKRDHMFTGKIGFGYVMVEKGFLNQSSGEDTRELKYAMTIPLMFNFLFGEKNHFELGIGAHYSDLFDIYLAGSIGFRHQPAKGGIMYKFCVTPHFPKDKLYDTAAPETVIKIWASAGLGYCW